MTSKAYPRANTRALFSAAMAGSALGLGLAAAYLAGVNSVSGLMHIRARALASAEAQGFSDVALQRANDLSPGALAIAQRHDPFTVSGADQRDRQSADFAARLEPSGPSSGRSIRLAVVAPSGAALERSSRAAKSADWRSR